MFEADISGAVLNLQLLRRRIKMVSRLTKGAGSEHGVGYYRINAAGHAAHNYLAGGHRSYHPRREPR